MLKTSSTIKPNLGYLQTLLLRPHSGYLKSYCIYLTLLINFFMIAILPMRHNYRQSKTYKSGKNADAQLGMLFSSMTTPNPIGLHYLKKMNIYTKTFGKVACTRNCNCYSSANFHHTIRLFEVIFADHYLGKMQLSRRSCSTR